jgi:hypothetical protein
MMVHLDGSRAHGPRCQALEASCFACRSGIRRKTKARDCRIQMRCTCTSTITSFSAARALLSVSKKAKCSFSCMQCRGSYLGSVAPSLARADADLLIKSSGGARNAET